MDAELKAMTDNDTALRSTVQEWASVNKGAGPSRSVAAELTAQST